MTIGFTDGNAAREHGRARPAAPRPAVLRGADHHQRAAVDTHASGTHAPGIDAPGIDASGIDASGTRASGFDASGTRASGTRASGIDASGTRASGIDAPGVHALAVPAADVLAPGIPAGRDGRERQIGQDGHLRIHDQAELRRVFGAFPTGVTAVAALTGGVPLGLAANSFTSVSLDPPIVSVCIARTSRSWPRLRQSARLGISVLGAHQEQASRQLAAGGADRFARLAWHATADGAVLVEGASAWLDCSVYDELTAGDHDLILLRVHELDADPAVAPLVFHGSRYRQLQP